MAVEELDELTTAVLGDVQRKIEAAEAQWLELEILREELARGDALADTKRAIGAAKPTS